jgi:hypothetical protein
MVLRVTARFEIERANRDSVRWVLVTVSFRFQQRCPPPAPLPMFIMPTNRENRWNCDVRHHRRKVFDGMGWLDVPIETAATFLQMRDRKKA